MKFALALFCLIALSVSCIGVTIHTVQYTTDPGIDNTFPSKYTGKSVSIEGIVTATNPATGGFYVSEPVIGPWRGILVLDKRYDVQPGDKVIVQGTVKEHFGMTTIQNLTGLKITDHNRSIPIPYYVTTGQLVLSSEAESFEGILVKVQNATCSEAVSANGRMDVTDGTSACGVDTRHFNASGKLINAKHGDHYNYIIGIVNYSFGEYNLCPRGKSDINVMLPTYNYNRSWGRIKSIYK